MKSRGFQILLLALVLFSSSCSLKRDLFLHGITLWHGHHRSRDPEFGKAEDRTISRERSVNKAEIITLQPKEIKSEGHATFKVKTETRRKRYHKIKSPFSITKTADKYSKPDQGNSKKISVSKINGIAFFSFLCAPLFIIALFTGLNALILSLFIGGILLAALAAYLAQGRKGCWMVGIAIGFWAVLLFYIALVVFVF